MEKYCIYFAGYYQDSLIFKEFLDKSKTWLLAATDSPSDKIVDSYRETLIQRFERFGNRFGPFVLMTSGFGMTALNGNPGSTIEKWNGVVDKFPKLVDGLNDRNAAWIITVGVRLPLNKFSFEMNGPIDMKTDGKFFTCFFKGVIRGQIAPEPRGHVTDHRREWNRIFIPDGATKTMAEMVDEEWKMFDARRLAFKELFQFLEGNVRAKEK